jgi:hypothetical protein
MNPLTAEEARAKLVLTDITKGRDAAVQITLKQLAQLCVSHGLFLDLPPLATGDLEQLWRDRIKQTLCRVWYVNHRYWRVRCPWEANFRIEPTKRTKR